jgi:hypothetical protein
MELAVGLMNTAASLENDNAEDIKKIVYVGVDGAL